MRRAAFCAALLLAGPACAQQPAAPPAQQPVPPEIQAVIQRTYNPPVDYSVVHTARVTEAGNTTVRTSA